jgi:predicted amidohydrolase YtcJ
VEIPVPLYGIFAAVNRTDLHNKPHNGWHKEQCINIKQAIAMYTTNAAYELNLEDELGKIKVGYRANFVALDEDLLKIKPKEIKNVKVVWAS